MRLYSGSSQQFVDDTTRNQIADKLKSAFFDYYRFNPSPGEVSSWRNSLRAMALIFQEAHLSDHGVLLEYQLPLTSKRLDCMICGEDGRGTENAVIVELKQWEQCKAANGENEVLTWVGGAEREILHPSVQVGQYKMYLEDTHTAFYSDQRPVVLNACTYLHNYSHNADDVIFSLKFKNALALYPLFTADDAERLQGHLVSKLERGHGLEVLKRVEESRYRPSKKLMNHVGNIIKGKSEYVLLDEQLIVYDAVLAQAKKGFHDKKKAVILVKGGPGTGKSVIAINLMADLLLKGYNAQYATGSKAFTETLRKVIGSRGAVQFKYFNSYTDAERDVIDVLIADESHRIRETSNSRYTKREKRSNLAQIDEMLKASKVVVFFIDDHQVVRPNEIGSVDYIKTKASQSGAAIVEHELEAQFRCNGSEAFVNWVNNTLGIKRTANVLWDQHEEFEFKIFASPEALEQAIRSRVGQGFTGRVTAGFCWEWSDPNPDGTLKDDVVVGEYRRPWDARYDAKKLAPGIPKASLWAHDPNGIDQVGCVYTAQGFEFDYVGVIWGPDLLYDFDTQSWKGDKAASHDSVVKRSGDRFADLVKNTYRVLLSRGLKGCYVYFMDKDTEMFVRTRIEGSVDADLEELQAPAKDKVAELEAETLPFRRLRRDEARPYVNCVPLYDLAVAAGRFSGEQSVDENPDDCEWIELPNAFRPQKGMFVAQVVGESMNRRIPNGAWCLFRLHPKGTRQGKVVLVQHREIQDADTGGHYTIKVYESEMIDEENGTWKHKQIILKPDTTAKGYEAIPLSEKDAEDLKVIAELVAVIG
jgi:uncharacterized protein